MYFNPYGSMSSGMPMYQGSYSPGFLSGYQDPKPRKPIPGFLSSDEAFTSRFGISQVSTVRTKPSRPKLRRQKESKFQINPTKKPTLTSSSSHESIEDEKKKKGKDIGIIEFSISTLPNNLGNNSKVSAQEPQAQATQASSSRPITMINHLSKNIKALYTRPNAELMSLLTYQNDSQILNIEVERERLHGKKVLFIIDNVDESVKLHDILDETRWFGPGSRVIIAVQDRKLLEAHRIGYSYRVALPSDCEALQIFCMAAFGHKFPKDGFEDLARKVCNAAGKLPLRLKIMGSYFRGMSK